MRADIVIALAAAIASTACKDKPAPATPPEPPAPPPHDAGAVVRETLRPALPTQPKDSSGPPVSVDEAAKVLPSIEGKEILPLKQTSDKRQVHGTWCIDGDGAEDVAKKVGRMMAQSGYAGLAIKGDAKKASVQGERSGYRMSMVVSASSAASCAAPLHYFASATIFRP